MDKIVDQEFLKILSIKLDQFRHIGPLTWRFRCPFCGDSQKSTTKARCYVYDGGKSLRFHCHNCPAHGGLYELIERVSPGMLDEYRMRQFVGSQDSSAKKLVYTPTKTLPIATANDIELLSIAELPNDHPARKYISNRLIPKDRWADLYYTDDFREFVMKKHPQNKDIKYSDKRIVIPVRNRDGALVAVQGNAINKSNLRYITIKLINEPKLYNSDNIDESKTVYILEGAYDSMFLPNAVASLDSTLSKVHFPNAILVFDNEPRNVEIVSKMEKAINDGYTVCIWPRDFKLKDINQMVQKGIPAPYIKEYIDNHAYNDLTARMELMEWRKI